MPLHQKVSTIVYSLSLYGMLVLLQACGTTGSGKTILIPDPERVLEQIDKQRDIEKAATEPEQSESKQTASKPVDTKPTQSQVADITNTRQRHKHTSPLTSQASMPKASLPETEVKTTTPQDQTQTQTQAQTQQQVAVTPITDAGQQDTKDTSTTTRTINYLAILKVLGLLALVVFIAHLTRKTLNHLQQKLASQPDSKVDPRLLAPVPMLLFVNVLSFGCLYAFSIWHISPLINNVLRSIALSMPILIWSRYLALVLHVSIDKITSETNKPALIKHESRPLFENAGFVLIVLAASYFLFLVWQVDITAWLASVGALGIAISFAAQNTLTNVFAGIFILADQPYKVGDFIMIDNGDRGKVTTIGLRSTRLLTRDDVEINIPNSIMGNSHIINESGGPHEKFRICVRLTLPFIQQHVTEQTFTDQIDQIKRQILDIARAEKQVSAEPEPEIRLRGFAADTSTPAIRGMVTADATIHEPMPFDPNGASGLNIELLCWVDQPKLQGKVIDQLNTAIYKRFIDEGLIATYNKQDLFAKEMMESNHTS